MAAAPNTQEMARSFGGALLFDVYEHVAPMALAFSFPALFVGTERHAAAVSRTIRLNDDLGPTLLSMTKNGRV